MRGFQDITKIENTNHSSKSKSCSRYGCFQKRGEIHLRVCKHRKLRLVNHGRDGGIATSLCGNGSRVTKARVIRFSLGGKGGSLQLSKIVKGNPN